MTPRLLYLRRSLAWTPVLAGCGAAVGAAVVLEMWPSTALLVLPALLAACACAAAHVFDEPAGRVALVTPRGTRWRGTTRLLAALAPVLVWAGVVAVRPGDLGFSQPGWLLAGTATILLSCGAAAVAGRRDVPSPGHVLAGTVAVGVIGPVVVTAFLDVTSPYPLTGFPDGVWVFWAVVAVVAAATSLSAVRSTVRT